MLRDEKWLSYAVKALKAVESGVTTTARIAYEIDVPASYLAKVMAVLRDAKIINSESELDRPLDKIKISELVFLADRGSVADPIVKVIVDHMMLGVANLSVQDVLNLQA